MEAEIEIGEMSQPEIEQGLEEASFCLQPERDQSLAGAAKFRIRNMFNALCNAKSE
jgi:hypothetical protein